ncbi:MAG: DUF5723 family protein [Bacteroidota bacterium]
MRTIISILYLLATCALFGQEQLGLRLDNYAGMHGVQLNPSHNVTSLFKWDLNLVSFGIAGHTNYGFIENANIRSALENYDNAILRRDIENSTSVNANTLIVDFSTSRRLKFATLFAHGMGPAFMLKLRNGHSLGFFTNGRFAFSTHRVPNILNYNTFFDTPFDTFIDVDPVKISAMAWSEFGLNYAARFDTYEGFYGIGFNLKFISAYEAAFVNTTRNTPSAQVNADTLAFQSPHLVYGITTANLEGEDIGVERSGFGVGFDLGFTYVYEGNEDHYKWKIGASLLDMGQIELSRNAEEHVIKTDSLILFPSVEFQSLSTNQERIALLSEVGLGDPAASLNSSSFRVGLPGAFSVHGDYMITPLFFIHGLWIQRIPMGVNSLRRNNLIAATPRLEHRWFGAAIPLSLTNYQKVNLGFAVRLAFLTLGSDDIGSFVRKGNLDSGDFYFALKINPFDLGWDIGGGGRGGRRRGKKVKCYEF